mgnify:FL=1
MEKIFDSETLAREFERLAAYLAANPGNNYVGLLEGSRMEDGAEGEKLSHLHLVPKQSFATDPKP